MTSKLLRSAALVLLSIATASIAHADWLVTHDGARVETQGPWKVEGRLVVFTRPGGTLASLRLSDVDLEASRKATKEAKEQTEKKKAEPQTSAAAQKPRKPIAVFTDKDFTTRPSRVGQGQEDAAEPTTPAAGGKLAVAGWQKVEDPADRHLSVVGSLRNGGAATASGIRLEVRIYDAQGRLVANRPATLSSGALPPGQTTDFTVDFPGIFAFSALKFHLESTPLTTTPEPQGGQGGAGR